jgi:hypothetical protein
LIGTSTPNSGVRTVVPKRSLYRSSSGCATSATQAGISSGRVVSLAVLELGLRDRGAEVDVPQRRRLRRVGLAAPQVAQERALRCPARLDADRRVGLRPVDRETEAPPQCFKLLLVFRCQPQAELDEVGPADLDLLLARALRRLEGQVVRDRRVAADAVVVLHPALGGQAVVVPAHRVEQLATAHPLVAREAVGLRVAEHRAHVQRAADRRRRRVDREDLVA